MKHLLILLLLVSAVGVAHAQGSGGYDLTWNTIDNGGTTFASDSSYELGGTAGQPDAGALGGGGYTLSGGFWPGGRIPAPPGYPIFLPLILHNRLYRE